MMEGLCGVCVCVVCLLVAYLEQLPGCCAVTCMCGVLRLWRLDVLVCTIFTFEIGGVEGWMGGLVGGVSSESCSRDVDCRRGMRFVHPGQARRLRQSRMRKTSNEARKIPHSCVKIRIHVGLGVGIGVLISQEWGISLASMARIWFWEHVDSWSSAFQLWFLQNVYFSSVLFYSAFRLQARPFLFFFFSLLSSSLVRITHLILVFLYPRQWLTR